MAKTSLLAILTLAFFGANGQENKVELQRILTELEKVRSASYTMTIPIYPPGEDIPMRIDTLLMQEFDNPPDTSIGASFGIFGLGDGKLKSFYDGRVRGEVYWDREAIKIDDFSNNPHPIRTVNPPFFNYTKSIISYTLADTTAEVTLTDLGDSLKLELIIHDKMIEFFGRPFEVKDELALWPEKFSKYTVWITKNEYLPYHFKRVMPHNTSERIIREVKLNQETGSNFIQSEYYPSHFSVEKLNRNKKPISENLIGKKAPSWSLRDKNDRLIKLDDLEGKVILIEFTGIGCGPCQLAIPFLNSLATSYQKQDFELVSIETWNSNKDVHSRYSDRYDLKYKFLMSNKEITNAYQAQGVPAFFLLDENRKIVDVKVGYNRGRTDEQLRDLIDKMLKGS